MADRVADLAAGVAAETPRPAGLSASAEAEDLGAPLYVAWQITNECNLACLHCIEESGPGKAFRDELDAAGVFAVIDELLDNDVPYLSFSAGEPMLHPHFFAMVERVCSRGAELSGCARPRARRIPGQHRPADAHRDGCQAVGQARAERRAVRELPSRTGPDGPGARGHHGALVRAV